jgi:hypothetical protein
MDIFVQPERYRSLEHQGATSLPRAIKGGVTRHDDD